MRREFILILLGIISTSTFSSLLSSYYQTETDNVLLDTVVGVVGAGNFSYWHFGHTGSLKIVLNSIKGDADLYVVENTRPTYDIHRNNYSSATCGVDVVDIPAEFPRPIGIGVFGYWSSAVSEYNIQIFLDNNPPYVKPLPEEAHQKVSYQGTSAGVNRKCKYISETEIDDDLTQCQDEDDIPDTKNDDDLTQCWDEDDEVFQNSQVYSQTRSEENFQANKKFKDSGTCTDVIYKKMYPEPTVIDLHGCNYFGQLVSNELLRFNINQRYMVMQKILEVLQNCGEKSEKIQP